MDISQIQNWPSAIAAIIVAVASVLMQFQRGRRIAAHQRNERMRYEAILKIAEKHPDEAAKLMAAQPGPARPDMGMSTYVLLILGASTALSGFLSPAALALSNRRRPVCTESGPVESASARQSQEPSSDNMHSTLAHMDPRDVWAVRRGVEQ